MNSFLHELTPFITQYGLWVIFFGMMVEGTTMIIATGILCYLGMIELKDALIVSILGAVIGDQIWFFIGKNYANLALKWFPKLKTKIEALKSVVIKKGALLSLSGRFVYSGAILFPLTLGLYKYPYKKFLLFDIIGVSIWASIGILIGKLLGNGIENYIGKIEKIWHIILIVIVVTVLVYTLKRYLKRRES